MEWSSRANPRAPLSRSAPPPVDLRVRRFATTGGSSSATACRRRAESGGCPIRVGRRLAQARLWRRSQHHGRPRSSVWRSRTQQRLTTVHNDPVGGWVPTPGRRCFTCAVKPCRIGERPLPRPASSSRGANFVLGFLAFHRSPRVGDIVGPPPDMEEEARRVMVTSVPDRRPMSQTSLEADVGYRLARAIGGEGVEPQKNSGFRVAADAGRRLLVGGKDCVARASTPSRNEVVQRGPRSSRRVQSRNRSKPETRWIELGRTVPGRIGPEARSEPRWHGGAERKRGR